MTNLKQVISLLKANGEEVAAKILSEYTKKDFDRFADGEFNIKTANEESGSLCYWILQFANWDKLPIERKFWSELYLRLLRKYILIPNIEKKETEKESFMSKEKPKKPGIYWWQPAKKKKKRVVQIWLQCNRLYVYEISINEQTSPYRSILSTCLGELEFINGFWSNKTIKAPTMYK